MKKRILPKKIRVAIYCRVSSDEAEQSLQEQVHICKEHVIKTAASKNVEIEFTHILIEEAGSSGGAAHNRPKYQQLLRLIKIKGVDWVAAKELSRFSRNVGDFSIFTEECRKNAVSIFIPGLDVDLESPSGEIVPNMLAVISQYERKINGQRSRSSIRSLAKTKSKIHGQPTILGFRRSDTDCGVWLPVEEKIADVIAIFKTFVRYKSYKTTIEILSKAGIKTQTGKDFNFSSLKRILVNRKYIGKLKVPGEDTEVDLPFGAVIPIELFESAQTVIRGIDTELKGKTRNPNRIYLLTGLLWTKNGNGFKGISAYGRGKNRFYYYRCYEEDMTFSSEEFESAILRAVEYFCKEKGLDEYKSELQSSQADKRSMLKKRMTAISREIDELNSLKSTSLDRIISSVDMSSVLIKEVEKRIMSINEQLSEKAKLRESISLELEELIAVEVGMQSLENLVKAGERLERDYSDRESVRGWLRSLFHKVVVDVQTKKINILWNEEITGGKILLPFKIDIPVGSRRMAIQSALDLSQAEIQESKLYELAVINKKTSSQIAKELGVSRSTVSKYLKKFSIPTLKMGANKRRVRGLSFGAKVLKSGKQVQVNDEQRIISAINTWREQGKTYREIAEILNVQGTPTKTGRGRWHGKTIHQILHPSISLTDVEVIQNSTS